jgi:hypothetical protein
MPQQTTQNNIFTVLRKAVAFCDRAPEEKFEEAMISSTL